MGMELLQYEDIPDQLTLDIIEKRLELIRNVKEENPYCKDWRLLKNELWRKALITIANNSHADLMLVSVIARNVLKADD